MDTARVGKLKLTQVLLDRGADPHSVDTKGWNAAYHACYNDKQNVFKLLIGRFPHTATLLISEMKNDQFNLLHFAVKEGENKITELIIDSGLIPDINC